MTESTTSVPTIADTIRNTLRDRGYGQYALYSVIEDIAQVLTTRERTLYGEAFQSGQPVTDEILRRLEENEAVGTQVQADREDLPIEQRVARLETEVENLTGFARQNGYRL